MCSSVESSFITNCNLNFTQFLYLKREYEVAIEFEDFGEGHLEFEEDKDIWKFSSINLWIDQSAIQRKMVRQFISFHLQI